MHACICYSECDEGRTRALHIVRRKMSLFEVVASRYFRSGRTNFTNSTKFSDRTSVEPDSRGAGDFSATQETVSNPFDSAVAFDSLLYIVDIPRTLSITSRHISHGRR